MKVTFWGVRGSIPAPGPSTVRYGGNTPCLSVETASGELIVIDCGTGARPLGLSLLSGPCGQGLGRGTLLLSHAHWDHIQGFPFFLPLYVPGNVFRIYGEAQSSAALEGILEGQMAPDYFPVQTLKNMGATIDFVALDGSVLAGEPLTVGGCQLTVGLNPHGPGGALAFRLEEQGRVFVYASDVGYGPSGPSPQTLALYRGAHLLVHDATHGAATGALYPERGHSSLAEAVRVALAAQAERLALFHYDQDLSDAQVDDLVAEGQALVVETAGTVVGRGQAPPLTVLGAAEGLALTV